MKNKLSNKDILVFAIIVTAYALLPYALGQSNCMFKAMFGLPCPGCGMTRACISLLKLDFTKAMHFHPLFWLPPIAFVAWIAVKNKSNTAANWIIYGFIALMLAVYVVRMVNMFPDIPPMNFNHDNIIAKLLMN